jgi:hypothetical protein
VGAAIFYIIARLLGAGYDTTHGWAWTGCFLGVVAFMRFETNFEERNPAYKALRGWLRLVLAFLGMFYFSVRSQGDPLGTAFVVAVVFVAILYFVLRSKWLRFVWHTLQQSAWMRASVASPLGS